MLCPDVDTFAPLIAAAFGPTGSAASGSSAAGAAGRPRPGAHQSAAGRRADTLLAAGRLAGSPPARCSTWRARAGRAAVRFRRAEDLETLRQMDRRRGRAVGASSQSAARAVRVGRYPAEHVQRGPATGYCSGVAADESDWRGWATALPLDDVASSDVDLAGRFAEYSSTG